MNIANWLYSTAMTAPGSPALLSGHELEENYRQFAQRASSISHSLRHDYKVKPGARVAFLMKNRIEYLKALYAVWWVGGVTVPINNRLHVKEATWIIENSEASILFTDAGPEPQGVSLPDSCTQIRVDTDIFNVMETGGPDFDPPLPMEMDALAWLFYTSGTTGRPKGVMLTHGNLVSMSLSYTMDVDEVSPQDAFLYAAPISHGAGLYNFVHVRKGARHVIPASMGFEPAEILDLAEQHDRLSLFAAPTMVKRLVGEARASKLQGNGIKSVIYGGGPMYLADLEDALDVLGPKFIQIYGQGESPMTITSIGRDELEDRDHPKWRERAASVGTAMSCVDVRVVDTAMGDLPAGTPGEVIVRGPTVMKGYWRNEKATSDTLVEGWLKTGDIGYLNAEGYLTLTDRSKDVIISGGSNIYPREVEEVLMRHSAILEAAVVGRPSEKWGEEVVAFVVIRPGESCDEETLEAWCKSEIASFKKPKHYEFCEALPKNSYGKILKTELREKLKHPAGQKAF